MVPGKKPDKEVGNWIREGKVASAVVVSSQLPDSN